MDQKSGKIGKPSDSIANGDVDDGELTDGRKQYEWMTRYPDQARNEIRWEGFYLFALFLVSLILVFANWKGWISVFLCLSAEETLIIKKYVYYALSGLIGGITFDIKYFYRVVARGWWHQDRRAWRIMSPFIAMTVSLFLGMMFNSSLTDTNGPKSTPTILLFGFLAGYFADKAVAKMYEIANVVFGKSATIKAGDG